MFSFTLVFECRRLDNIRAMLVLLGLVMVAICGIWISTRQGKIAVKPFSASGKCLDVTPALGIRFQYLT